ncbi:hypothetical protein NQ317_014458 [Molorchus minor]|uniref:Uncharacterized protein n=1 Tax=Molorchus minor TaxID=1323400 RepID=A0ABQ9IT89_9CUCU|nr:hypothetical protein NQ317_014458 [Molorchus minor]
MSRLFQAFINNVDYFAEGYSLIGYALYHWKTLRSRSFVVHFTKDNRKRQSVSMQYLPVYWQASLLQDIQTQQ